MTKGSFMSEFADKGGALTLKSSAKTMQRVGYSRRCSIRTAQDCELRLFGQTTTCLRRTAVHKRPLWAQSCLSERAKHLDPRCLRGVLDNPNGR
jgi:hypothetical protein